MSISDNSESIPESLIKPGLRRSDALYIDVNPIHQPGLPVLVYDSSAVFASIRNLFLSSYGSRGRIFQEDYFSGVYELLFEPVDDTTALQVRLAIYQALHKWEPRITINPADIDVIAQPYYPGYSVTLGITINGQRENFTFNLKKN